ncbi:MAG: hypothetical protein AAF764_00785 [Pseudomonadota bacterium]
MLLPPAAMPPLAAFPTERSYASAAMGAGISRCSALLKALRQLPQQQNTGPLPPSPQGKGTAESTSADDTHTSTHHTFLPDTAPPTGDTVIKTGARPAAQGEERATAAPAQAVSPPATDRERMLPPASGAANSRPSCASGSPRSWPAPSSDARRAFHAEADAAEQRHEANRAWPFERIVTMLVEELREAAKDGRELYDSDIRRRHGVPIMLIHVGWAEAVRRFAAEQAEATN